ncbi:hypothetical protein ACFY7Z_31325 [Streptomyces sp. NPDC012623]|uniref:hypothetical protein n=1 Tax=unclassified Streptomyces TaxID=2593676 RepID=UPI0036BF4FC9
MTTENEANKDTNGTAGKAKESAKSATSKGRQTAERTGATARGTAKTAGGRAKNGSAGAAAKARTSVRAAEESADSGVRSAGDATKHIGQAASAGWESGQQAVLSTANKAVSTATTAWTVIKHRKAIAAGAAAGVVGLAGGAFALGRQTARPHGGPLTRMTGGRF